jgi:CBS domain-containing protein
LDPPSAILVGEVMTRDPQTTTPEEPAWFAGRALVESHIGALPVLHTGRLIGILSKADFLSYLLSIGSPDALVALGEPA